MSTENGAAIKFINAQALIVTAIFGLFGGALTSFIGIKELSLRYMSIAGLLGLVLILLINLLLRVSKKAYIKMILKLIAVILFVGLVFSFFRYDGIYGDATFEYTDIDTVKTNFIKGTDKGLQQSAAEFLQRFIKDNGRIPTDQELIDNAGGIYEKAGINNIANVWTPASILSNKRLLIKNYILMAMLFLASIYFITEVILIFYKERKRPASGARKIKAKEPALN
ncbi:hypothetical protein WG954_19580 [Lacibacter sp. H375]|uniref:hypothetical protein n=1 Tax=Lacibacter sp. H375 TaxID=3133424 RepID=UPI0030BCD36E